MPSDALPATRKDRNRLHAPETNGLFCAGAKKRPCREGSFKKWGQKANSLETKQCVVRTGWVGDLIYANT